MFGYFLTTNSNYLNHNDKDNS